MIISKVRKILFFLISRRATAVSNARDLTGPDMETTVLPCKKRSRKRRRPRNLKKSPCERDQKIGMKRIAQNAIKNTFWLFLAPQVL